MQLVVAGLGRWLGGRPLFRTLSFALEPGGCLAVTGPTGCGKTTLLACCAGLDRPDAGRVTWDGTDLWALGAWRRDRRRRRDCALLQADGDLDPTLSVGDNLRLGACFRGQGDGDLGSVAEDLGLGSVLGLAGHQLSSGQAQRVALGRALLARPRLLIADEPTAHLDRASAEVVARALLAAARRDRFALLVATHDQALAAACDQRLDLAEAPACS